MTIQAYFHCRTCLGSKNEKLQVGATDPVTITVHCDGCDQDVGSFRLAAPLPPMNCGVCNKPLGPGHVH